VNAGFVIEPLSGLSANVDYYWVEVKNPIITPTDAYIFDNFAQLAPTHVVRKPPDTQYPVLPGEIDYLIENQFNAAKLRTSGIDIDVRWPPPTPIGAFKLGLNGTYVIEYKQTLFPVQTNPEAATGTRGPLNGAVSR
jgi:outer membrane receptor protein involved in Fe transport